MSNINNTKEQYELNRELAQMLKGGVIMDVTNAEQAKTAEAAGACAVMALERIPADIRAAGGDVLRDALLYCKRFTGVVWLQYRCVCHSVCNIAVCQFCRSYRRSAW